MIHYFKKENQTTKFNDENLDLLHIFSYSDNSYSYSLQKVDINNKNLVLNSLRSLYLQSSENEFNIVLSKLKNNINSL